MQCSGDAFLNAASAFFSYTDEAPCPTPHTFPSDIAFMILTECRIHWILYTLNPPSPLLPYRPTLLLPLLHTLKCFLRFRV